MKYLPWFSFLSRSILVISLSQSFIQARAVTTNLGPDPLASNTTVFGVNEGVIFTIDNNASSDFTFNWTDPLGGSFSSIADPSLILTLGQTYTFQRISNNHPFALMDASAISLISNNNLNYSRNQDSTLIQSATFLTANPPPGAAVTWTPNAPGTYFYTCTVTIHTDMVGSITVVVPEPSTIGLVIMAFVLIALSRRFSRRFKASS